MAYSLGVPLRKQSEERRLSTTIHTERVSTSSVEMTQIWKSFREKEFRDAYVSEHINTGVSLQIRANRKAQGLTQKQLGERASMKQNHICRLENPDHSPNLETLKRIASALDIALIVRFVPFSELAQWACGVESDLLEVATFMEDQLPESVSTSVSTPGQIAMTELTAGSFAMSSSLVSVSHHSTGLPEVSTIWPDYDREQLFVSPAISQREEPHGQAAY